MPEIKIRVKGYRCNNCNNEWVPRSDKEKPLICPKCKSARWDLPKRVTPKIKVEKSSINQSI